LVDFWHVEGTFWKFDAFLWFHLAEFYFEQLLFRVKKGKIGDLLDFDFFFQLASLNFYFKSGLLTLVCAALSDPAKSIMKSFPTLNSSIVFLTRLF